MYVSAVFFRTFRQILCVRVSYPFKQNDFLFLQSISAKVNNEPCCDWVGADGAGHYVKMVHNGIEYGDMQVCRERERFMKYHTSCCVCMVIPSARLYKLTLTHSDVPHLCML